MYLYELTYLLEDGTEFEEALEECRWWPPDEEDEEEWLGLKIKCHVRFGDLSEYFALFIQNNAILKSASRNLAETSSPNL